MSSKKDQKWTWSFFCKSLILRLFQRPPLAKVDRPPVYRGQLSLRRKKPNRRNNMKSNVEARIQKSAIRKQEPESSGARFDSALSGLQHPVSNSHHSITPPLPSPARYALRNTFGFWELTFDGQCAV